MRWLAAASLACTVCTVDLADKRRCRDDDDCLDGRFCLNQQCEDPSRACPELCLDVCEGYRGCGLPGLDDCAAACEERVGPLAWLPAEPSACAETEPADANVGCEAARCRLRCDAFCNELAACGELDQAMLCEQHCLDVEFSLCSAPVPDDCGSLYLEYLCLEKRVEYGPAVDCQRDFCRTDGDCEAARTCVANRCFDRCSTPDECSSGECLDGHCPAPVGAFCRIDGDVAGDCGAPDRCIDIDEDGIQATPYCTRSCDPESACPDGYRCVDETCRVCEDPAKCPCPYKLDGECDEPQGTGLCPSGTDPSDCAE